MPQTATHSHRPVARPRHSAPRGPRTQPWRWATAWICLSVLGLTMASSATAQAGAAQANAARDTTARDPAAQRLFDEAKRLEAAGDQEAALRELGLLVQQFPRDTLAPKALLATAELSDARGDRDGARSALERLFNAYPRTLEAAAGFVLEAEIRVNQARSTQDLEEARTSYRRVPLLYGADRFPDLEPRSRALLESAEIGLRLGDVGGAAAELLAIVEDEPPGAWTPRARLLLAKALVHQGETTPAIDLFQRIVLGDGAAGDGAADDGTAVDDGTRGEARRWLSLLHRHVVRPAAGSPIWTTTRRFPSDGTALREPSGVAAGHTGRILVVDAKADMVFLVDADGGVLQRKALKDAERPGWSTDSWPHVVSDREVTLPFHGQRTGFLEPRPDRENPLKGMGAAARGIFGDWFVLARGYKGLLVYESRRRGTEVLAASRADFVDLAQDPTGRVYALDARGKQVLRIGHDRRSEGAVVRGAWRRPEALAIDALGKLYVLDRGNSTIEIYAPTGQRLQTLGPQLGNGVELRSPMDIAVDADGRLLIADRRLPFIVVLD